MTVLAMIIEPEKAAFRWVALVIKPVNIGLKLMLQLAKNTRIRWGFEHYST